MSVRVAVSSCVLVLSSLAFVVPSLTQAQEPALAGLRAATKAARNDASAAGALGRGLLRAGRHREAEAELRRAARLARNAPEALYAVASVAFAQGDYRRAQAACRPLAGARGSAPATWGRLCNARTFLVWNRSSRAFEELEAGLAAEPNQPDLLIALGDAHRLRAAVAESESAYQRALAAAPSRADALLGLGRLYAAANRRNDAEAALRRAIAADAEDPEIQLELGRLLGGTDEAHQLLQRAAAGCPGSAEAQVALGESLLASRDAQAAEAAFAQALRLNTRLAAAHTGLGRAKAARGDLEGAEASLREALELVPNSADGARALADVLAQRQDYEGAFEQYRHAADLDPRNPSALVLAARLAITANRDVLAAGFLDRVLEAHPDLPEGLALYGDIMRARADRAAARTYYERSLRARGDNPDRARVEAALRELGPATPPARPRR